MKAHADFEDIVTRGDESQDLDKLLDQELQFGRALTPGASMLMPFIKNSRRAEAVEDYSCLHVFIAAVIIEEAADCQRRRRRSKCWALPLPQREPVRP